MYGLTGSAHDQAAGRRGTDLTDDWGRVWTAVIDKKSGDPIGSVTPKGWSAPWRPDPAYMRPDPDRPHRLVIDLHRALDDALEAHESYRAEWEKTAAARNLDPLDERNRPVLLQVVGPAPKPWQPIKAALDGNRYILGFTTTVDPRLVPYLVTKRERVVASRQGLESFADDAGLDARLDLEEAVDPEYVGGGKRVPVSAPKSKGGRPKKILPESL